MNESSIIIVIIVIIIIIIIVCMLCYSLNTSTSTSNNCANNDINNFTAGVFNTCAACATEGKYTWTTTGSTSWQGYSKWTITQSNCHEACSTPVGYAANVAIELVLAGLGGGLPPPPNGYYTNGNCATFSS